MKDRFLSFLNARQEDPSKLYPTGKERRRAELAKRITGLSTKDSAYDIAQAFAQGFAALADRSAPLSPEEAKNLQAPPEGAATSPEEAEEAGTAEPTAEEIWGAREPAAEEPAAEEPVAEEAVPGERTTAIPEGRPRYAREGFPTEEEIEAAAKGGRNPIIAPGFYTMMKKELIQKVELLSKKK